MFYKEFQILQLIRKNKQQLLQLFLDFKSKFRSYSSFTAGPILIISASKGTYFQVGRSLEEGFIEKFSNYFSYNDKSNHVQKFSKNLISTGHYKALYRPKVLDVQNVGKTNQAPFIS